MKYLFVNSVYGVRSTGKIILEQCRNLQAQGHQCAVAYGREAVEDPTVEQIRIGNTLDQQFHAVMTRLFDLHGFCSRHATKQFLKAVEAYQPDVIWMHNIHGYYLNIELWFEWLKAHPGIRKIWTLHDCWAFTGHCAYFTMARCEQWRTECRKCSGYQKRSYPKTLLGARTGANFHEKKAAFCDVRNLELITPSKWLADLVGESFLREYPVSVVHNTVDTKMFHPVESDYKQRHGLQKRYIVLGVAVGWEKTKGLQDMLALRELLSPRYVMILVGVPKRVIPGLPQGVIAYERTANQEKLIELYSAADVLVNPTHQDNYPTVNLEARACGTPVVTYNVGGSPESAGYEYIVEENDVAGLAEKVRSICERHAF